MSGAFDIGAAIARLTPGQPLLIVDADEVLLRFVAGFEKFIAEQDLYLDLRTYRLHGNVKRRADGTAILDVEVSAILEEFRRDLDSLEVVPGAREALTALALRADIVVLSNVNAGQALARARNLAAFGLDLPIVSNAGPKGPAVKALSSRAGTPVFFVDDIPQHLESAEEHAPHVLRIHLVGEEKLKPLLSPAPCAHLRAADWQEAARFMHTRLDERER